HPERVPDGGAEEGAGGGVERNHAGRWGRERGRRCSGGVLGRTRDDAPVGWGGALKIAPPPSASAARILPMRWRIDDGGSGRHSLSFPSLHLSPIFTRVPPPMPAERR